MLNPVANEPRTPNIPNPANTIATILAQFLSFHKPLATKKLKTVKTSTSIAEKITSPYPQALIAVKNGNKVPRKAVPAKRKIANKIPKPALI